MQAKHLGEVVDCGGAAVGLGDYFDVMSAKNDPRGHKGGYRQEYGVPNHFDAIIKDAADWLTPYAKNIAMLGQGNHETNLLHRAEFCITERLIGMVNANTGARIHNGGYSGWIVFRFNFKSAKSDVRGSFCINAHYHHGHSSGKSSANIAAHEKRAAFTPDADIIMTGHAHNFWQDIVGRMRLGARGTYQDEQLHIGCPSYKDDIGSGRSGWAVEKGFRNKVLGAWWLRFYYSKKAGRVKVEAIPAR